MAISTTDHNRLTEIKDEIKNLLDEAKGIIQDSDNDFIWEQARSYWYAHILTALDDESEFLGDSMCAMQQTIDALAPDETYQYENSDECEDAGVHLTRCDKDGFCDFCGEQ